MGIAVIERSFFRLLLLRETKVSMRKHSLHSRTCIHADVDMIDVCLSQSPVSYNIAGNKEMLTVSRLGLMVRRVSGGTSVRTCFGSPFTSKLAFVYRHRLVTLSLTINETLK